MRDRLVGNSSLILAIWADTLHDTHPTLTPMWYRKCLTVTFTQQFPCLCLNRSRLSLVVLSN